MPIWSQIIITLLSSTVVVELVRWLRERRVKFTPVDAVALNSEVNTILRELLSNTGAESVVLFQTENGPMLTTPGQVIRVTVSNEVCKNSERSFQRGFVATPVDVGFCELLREVFSGGIIQHPARELRSDLLRDVYRAYNVSQGWFLLVPSPTRVIRCLSVQWAESTVPANDGDLANVRTQMRIAADAIRRAMVRYE